MQTADMPTVSHEQNYWFIW